MADELQVVVEKIVADSSASQANLLNKILKKLHLFSANEEADTYQRGAGVIEKLALGLTKTSELLKKCERDCQQAKARYLPMIRQYEVSRLAYIKARNEFKQGAPKSPQAQDTTSIQRKVCRFCSDYREFTDSSANIS